MKKKAIAELEFLDWLKIKLPKVYHQKQVEVSKAGGDAFLWFLRQGGITREPDFIVKVGGKVESFKLDDPYISEEKKTKVLAVAQRYFELAESYI